MTDKELLRVLFKQVNKSFEIAKKEQVEEIALYKEFYAKLSLLSGNKKTFDEMNDTGTLFATIGNIRSKKRTKQAINIAKQFLSSKWASSEGRERIYKQSIKTGTQNKAVSEEVYKRSVRYMADVQKYNRQIQKSQALKTVDIIENEVAEDLHELWLPPSDLIFIINEIIEDNGFSPSTFYDCLDYVERNARSLEDMDDMREAVYHYFDEILND